MKRTKSERVHEIGAFHSHHLASDHEDFLVPVGHENTHRVVVGVDRLTARDGGHGLEGPRGSRLAHEPHRAVREQDHGAARMRAAELTTPAHVRLAGRVEAPHGRRPPGELEGCGGIAAITSNSS